MKRFLTLFLVLTCVVALVGCSNKAQNYKYNNLTNEQSLNEFCEVMTSHSVPSEDIDALLNFVRVYGEESYAEKNLQGDWKTAKTNEHLYDYDEAITSYSDSPFDDLSCREAAFIIYNSFIKVPDNFEVDINKDDSPLFSDLAILDLQKSQMYYDCYEVLFCPFESEESVTDAVVKYWKSHNIEFKGEDVHLVTLFGKKDGKTINIHCGVLFENEDGTYFFEKTDPLMPYQISVFESFEDIKYYLINRPGEDDYKDKTVFIDYKVIN